MPDRVPEPANVVDVSGADAAGAVERTPLTTATIVATGVRMADESGVAKLSMRGVARTLGYEVMSLYNHVEGKDDLLAGMVDAVAEEVPNPEPYGDPLDAVRFLAVGTRAALARHPWAAALWQASSPGPGRLRLMESLLAALAASDLSPEAAHHGYHAVNNHVLGYTLQADSMGIDPGGPGAETAATRFLDGLDEGAFPHTVAHVRQHLEGESGPSFELVLDLIIDGLLRLR